MSLRRSPIREVEHKARTGPGTLLTGLAVFAAVLMLLAGKVRLYELRQETAALQTELEQRREELAELPDLPDLYRRAVALGLETPAPEEIVILHLRD